MIALVLAGARDPRHRWFVAPVLRRRAGIRVVGVSEPDPQSRGQVAALYDLPAWDDHHEMLEATSPSLVGVTGPDSGRITLDALDAGADVLVVPPLCRSTDDLATITDRATATGRTVTMLLSYRAHPATRTALELRGKLGAVGLVSLSLSGEADRDAQTRSVMEALDVFALLTDTTIIGADLQFHPATDGDDDPEVREAMGDLLFTVTVGDPDGPALEVRRSSVVQPAREIIQVVGAEGALEWNTHDGLMRSALGDQDPISVSCGAFVHPEDWVLTDVIRARTPPISTEHSLAVMQFGLAAREHL